MAGARNPNFELGFRSISLILFLLLLASFPLRSESSCRRGCDLAIGSYYVSNSSDNLTYISSLFNQAPDDVLRYNPNISNKDSIDIDSRINISFSSCDCLPDGSSLGRMFSYLTPSGVTYTSIASTIYANLTNVTDLETFNSYPPNNIPNNVNINVTVRCFCGDADVSREYGLFVTYPLRPGENLSTVAAEWGFRGQEDLLQRYNQGMNFSAGEGIVFIPTKDLTGSYHPLQSSKGLSAGAIVGISIAALFAVLVLAICIYFGVYGRKKGRKTLLLPSSYEDNAILREHGSVDALDKTSNLTPQDGSGSQLPGIAVDKSVEFSYEELASATNDFSLNSKIGEGGFGAVYYAELRGEKAAIKKMDMHATKEFLAELQVLTHVHHLNLVRLLGYCIKDSLFLVYEYIENGNLSQHLRGSGRNPLPWSARVQIALDSARGLEYIHEHTVPQYIHRDIKSANILIDKNFRSKVADFGLTKLTEFGILPDPTRAVGTFGYMPPEYAQLGDVSSKVDVYAFGVVLYELISAKEAVVKTAAVTEFKGLVALFEDALSQPDPKEHLRKLVDPRLGDDYPIDSVYKIAQLAKACTQEDPQLRPSMRSIVVALMVLSSSTEDWDVGALYGNPALGNLMSGR